MARFHEYQSVLRRLREGSITFVKKSDHTNINVTIGDTEAETDDQSG